MQEKIKTPEQKLREACYEYLEEYISKSWGNAEYQSHIQRKYGKYGPVRVLGVIRQSEVERKHHKQIALDVLRLIESLNPSNSKCAICDLDTDCSAFSDKETEKYDTIR